MWVCFLGYLAYMFVLMKKGEMQAEEIETKDTPIWKMILMGVIGLVLIIWGSDITVNAATSLAKMFGMSERFIGLTIVALGTSLPELFTSVVAARRGKADIAIGNIVGSNVFNILFVVGTTALITPVIFEKRFLIDSAIALAAGLLLWFGVMKELKLKRPIGIVMLLAYAAYFVYLLIQA